MNSIYGTDLMIVDGDISFTSQGDIYTTKEFEFANQDTTPFEGFYNIYFALTDRLITIKADNVFHSEYGSNLYNLLSSPNSSNFRKALEQTVRESLLADDRVKSIKSIDIEQKDSEVFVKVNLMLIGADQASEFVFPTFVTG